MKNRKSILIVDDDKLLFEAMRSLLDEYGHTVSFCDNGLAAIKLSQERHFDLILTDYNMPGIKGDEVCRSIRYYDPDAFIIGFSVDSKSESFINAGANKFVYKDQLFHDLSTLNKFVELTP